MVRHSAQTVASIVKEIDGTLPALLPGYRVKIIDGNCLAATEHRIKELRRIAAGALPGKSLVVLDPALKLVVDVFPCEDGHAQERSLLDQVIKTVEPDDCWNEDRNFCTLNFLFGLEQRDAYCVVRQHQNLPWRPVGRMKKVGRNDPPGGGMVYEQPICVTDDQGREIRLRRVRIALDQPTRNDEHDVFVLTNLPEKVSK